MCPEESTYEQRDKMISSIIDYYFEKHQPNLNVPVEISQQFRSKYDSMIDIQAKFRRPKFTGEKYTVLESGDPMGLSEEEYDEVVKNYSADLLQDQVTEKLGHMNHLSSFEKLLKIQGLGKQARPMGKEVRRMMTQQLIDSFSQQDRDNIYADNRFNNLGAPLKETLRQSQIGAILKQVQEMSPIEKLLQLQHVDFYEKRFVMSSIIKNLSKEEVQSVMDDGRWGELDLKLQANLEYHQDLLE